MVRVIKQYAPDRIAAEILNQLFGKEYIVYADGALRFNPDALMYPLRKVGIANHRIVSTRMWVFVDAMREDAERDIRAAVNDIIDLVPAELRVPANVFSNIRAHTASAQICAKPIRTRIQDSGLITFVGDDKSTHSGCRFVCVIGNTTAFDLKLTSEYPDAAMAKYGCGLYVDEYNTLTSADNELVWSFPPEIFRSHGKMIELPEQVTLTASQPLGLQLHNTREVYASEYTKMRDKLNKPVRVAPREWFTLDPPTVSIDSKQRSDKLCARCKGVLFDECYILLKQTPTECASIALHPICLHWSPAEHAVEDQFEYVFRVKFPLSAADIAVHSDPVITDVMQHALLGCQRVEYVFKGGSIVYYRIGTKYVYFMHPKDYQFRACMLDDIRDRVAISNVNIVTA